MAQRRMFSLSVVDTDAFLDMPSSTQALYFHLGMRADDDGFVASPKKIAKIANCSTDDFKLLVTKGFVIVFQSGVCVVKDWKQNNYIPKDRYHPSIYTEEKTFLTVCENGSYCIHDCIQNETINDTPCIQTVYNSDTEVRLGKDSIGKVRLGKDSGEDSCAELETSSTPPVIFMPLNDGSDYPIYQSQCDEWGELYPAVDVMQQLRNMRGWCLADKKRRKTKNGVLRFIAGWLSREQNAGGRRTSSFQQSQQQKPTWSEIGEQLEQQFNNGDGFAGIWGYQT